MLVKTSDPDFHRDQDTTALINTNVSAFKQYKLARATKNSSMQNERKIEQLENEIQELKTLVKELIKDRNG